MTIRLLTVLAASMTAPITVSAALPAPPPPVRETKPRPVYPARALKPQRPVIDSDLQYVVYLADGGPLFLRLHIQVDGKSYNALWREYIAGLFRDVDRDGNRLISRDEAQRGLPSYQQMMRTGLIRRNPGQRLPRLPETMFNGATMTRKELAGYYRRIGLRAFRLQVNSRYSYRGSYGRNNYAAMRSPAAILFARLDRDGNERLSAAELRSALSRMRKLDLDDDGTISQTELQSLGGNYVASYSRSATRTAGRPVRATDPMIAFSPGEATDLDIRRILDRYDRAADTGGSQGSSSGDDRLDRSEIGLTQAVFRKYDRDRSGRLDFEELRSLLNRPPSAVDVTARLGRRGKSRPAIEVRDLTPAAGISIQTGNGGLVLLNVGSAQIRLVADTTVDTSAQTKALYATQFKIADRDKNRYLTLNEVSRSYYFRSTFKLMDRDGDGKVFQREMLAYLDSQAALTSSRVVASVNDPGRDLFRILDRNQDGRLGQKEFVIAARGLAAWDKNGDRSLALTEVPRNLVLTIGRGRSRSVGMRRILAVDRPGSVRSTTRTAAGPPWFRKMDVNGDSDVSRREFLGTAAQFAALDADKDGVINAKEASVLRPAR